MQLHSSPAPLLLLFGLLACSAAVGRAQECGDECLVLYSATNYQSCLQAAFPSRGGGLYRERLVLPKGRLYDASRTLSNARFGPKPSAIVFARSTADVVAAVNCATPWGVKVTVAAGRHAYQGNTMYDGYLTIDVSNMTKLEIIQSPVLSARVGPGNTNTLIATALRTHAPKDVYAMIGQCPSVSVSGFTLGGGMGLTSPTAGLSCDNLLELEMVLYNGTVIVANASHHPDVMWASCGGGGGLGVVTEYVLRLHKLPSKVFCKVALSAPASSFIDLTLRAQNYTNGGDPRVSGGGVSDTGMLLIFWGPKADAVASLQAAGLLDPALITLPPLIFEFDNYGDMFLEESCSVWIRNFGGIAQLFPGKTDRDCFNLSFLTGDFAKESAKPRSPISQGSSFLWRSITIYTCHLLDRLSRVALEALEGPGIYPECAPLLANTSLLFAGLAAGTPLSARCVAQQAIKPKINHIMGGAITSVAPNATAFFHRTKFSPVCVESSPWPESVINKDGIMPAVVKNFPVPFLNSTATVHPAVLLAAWQAEISSRWAALTAVIGKDEAHAGYLNYQAPIVPNWQGFYFGRNGARLASIKAEYDPLSVFSKPYVVEGVPNA